MQLGMASREIEKETTQNRIHVLSSYWHYLLIMSMTQTSTAKSQYAYRILERLDIFFILDYIIELCFADAFNEQYNSLNYHDPIEPHNKCGSIYFLRSILEVMSKNPPFDGSSTDDYFNAITTHFEYGADTKLQYEFRDDYSLRLSFSIRDRYIRRNTDFFHLLLHIHIDDFRNGYADRLDAYTQPLIDDEEEILATLTWHELSR